MSAPPGYFNLAQTDLWLAAVSQITKVPNALGVRAGGENSAPGTAGRIDWIPVSLAPGDCAFVQQDTLSAGDVAVKFDVCIVSSDFGQLLILYKALYNAVDVCFGPPQGGPDAGGGYKMGESSKPVRGGVVGSETWSTTVRVELGEPAEREYFPPSPIVSATLQVDLANASGAEQAIPIAEGPP
jgi:hypothetical protein